MNAKKTEKTMNRESKINGTEARCRREIDDRQAEVLDELQVKGENGCWYLYSRALKSVKNRLIMDDEYEPSENLSLVRVLTMLERDLEVLNGAQGPGAEAEDM